MHLCYVDESGTPESSGNTSHYVLAGLSIPIYHWRDCDREVSRIRNQYALNGKELHTAWILRSYLEQSRIDGFLGMTFFERRQAVEQWRRAELIRLQKTNDSKAFRQQRKSFRHTDPYIHLSLQERKSLVLDLAKCISKWGFARLFAECINKITFSPQDPSFTADEQALEQVVSRFEHFLRAMSGTSPQEKKYGLIIHDNNDTVSKKHTELMQKFHRRGTLWTDVTHISETPLFVNSQLTDMVQMVDLCAYALRRYLENQESDLFDLVFVRADRKDGKVVGIRHFAKGDCGCKICAARGRGQAISD